MILKNLLFTCFFTGLLLSVFISCQQEPDSDFNPPPPSVNDSAYLQMITDIDTISPSGFDTLTKQIFIYDAQKRINVEIYYDYMLGNPIPLSIDTARWFYHGNDTLPYKYTETWFDAASFLTYDNGVVIKDSVVYSDPGFFPYDEQVFTFTRLSDNRYRTIEKQAMAGVLVTLDTTYGVITRGINNEMLVHKDTLYRSGVITAYSENRNSFDNKSNPYQRIGIPYLIPRGDRGLEYEQRLSNNLITEYIKFKDESGFEWEENRQANFIYRADGYPISRVMVHEPEQKRLYFYTRL